MGTKGLSPLITVIMATYNSSKTLKLAIESALAQDMSDFEILVVGDGCTDDSGEVVRSFGDTRLSWVNLPENSGSQGVPNNEGLRRAKGDYIAFLGHDDLWFPWHLSSLAGAIRESGADLVHPLIALLSPSGLEGIVGPPGEGKTYGDHFVMPSGWLHKKDIVDDCGYWGDSSNLYLGVDFDYLRRVHRSGKLIQCVGRLSLLKFPSWMWGTYAADYNPGQLEYSIQLKEDPEALETEILTGSALLLSRRFRPRRKTVAILKDLFRSVLYRVRDLYGRDRWPLKQILVFRFQRLRKKLKKKTGLTR